MHNNSTYYKHTDVTFNFAQDTPRITGNNMSLYLDFQGCSAVTCSAPNNRDVDCKFMLHSPANLHFSLNVKVLKLSMVSRTLLISRTIEHEQH